MHLKVYATIFVYSDVVLRTYYYFRWRLCKAYLVVGKPIPSKLSPPISCRWVGLLPHGVCPLNLTKCPKMTCTLMHRWKCGESFCLACTMIKCLTKIHFSSLLIWTLSQCLPVWIFLTNYCFKSVLSAWTCLYGSPWLLLVCFVGVVESFETSTASRRESLTSLGLCAH